MVYLSRSSFSGSSSGSDSCADPEKSDGHRNNEEGRRKGSHMSIKITVEFVASILLFLVVVIVFLLRGK